MQACVDLPDDMIASCRRDARAGVPNLFGTGTGSVEDSSSMGSGWGMVSG